MQLSRRELIRGTAALAAPFAPRPEMGAVRTVTPEQFGALGDGRTNDTDAFAAMSRFITAAGGGTIELRATTYIVGRQSPDRRNGYRFAPARIMHFSKCHTPLIIHGNGARLKCADGLRYGTFDPDTGRPNKHTLPYYGADKDLASPYFSMVGIEDCTAAVEITDLELDGNIERLTIGGQYGDADWQIGAVGIKLSNNLSSERVARVRSHHHPQDGLVIDGSMKRTGPGRFEQVACESNGRQGCSIVGGHSYSFTGCRFNNSGQGRLSSRPGAGVDIEAEGKRIRDLTFENCEFSNDRNAGLLADSGNSEGATFRRCRFIGTTGWSAWPNKPRFRFFQCTFVGSIVSAYGDADPSRATQFHDCTFRDDPALSPTGQVYDAKTAHPIAELPYSRNVLFNRCRFLLTHAAVLPWTTNVVIFSDCVMSQKSRKQSYPRGTFVGRNRIDGNVDLYSSIIRGQLVVNGKLIPRSA
jgi:hypothetical protein